MKTAFIIIFTLLIISIFWVGAVWGEEQLNEAINIRVTDYPEKIITISHEFEVSAKVLKSDYYKCLDVCFCDTEPKEICDDICKHWCYNNY